MSDGSISVHDVVSPETRYNLTLLKFIKSHYILDRWLCLAQEIIVFLPDLLSLSNSVEHWTALQVFVLLISKHYRIIRNVLWEAPKILSILVIGVFPLFNDEDGEEVCPPRIRKFLILNQVPMLSTHMSIQLFAKWRYFSDLLHGNPLGVGHSNNIFASLNILRRHNISIRRSFPPCFTLVYFCTFTANVAVKLCKILSLDVVFWDDVIHLNFIFNFFAQNYELFFIRGFFDTFV